MMALPRKIQPLNFVFLWCPARQRLPPIEIHLATREAVFYINQFTSWPSMLTVLKQIPPATRTVKPVLS